jgi:hypothetical protein
MIQSNLTSDLAQQQLDFMQRYEAIIDPNRF